MKSFLMGLGMGALLGVMIAPEEGSNSRRKIIENARNWFGLGPGREGQGETQGRRGTQAQTQPQDVWEQVRQQQAGPERQVAEEAEKESEVVAEVLNTAKRDELLSVPGIGKGTAKRIIKNRPYESEEDVLEEGVMPEETLERVKEQLVEEKKRDIA